MELERLYIKFIAGKKWVEIKKYDVILRKYSANLSHILQIINKVQFIKKFIVY